MPVDCSMTNWFYNSIKAARAREGGGDKQGGEGSSQWGMRSWIFNTDSCEGDGRRPELTWLGGNYGWPDDTEADCSVRVQAEAQTLRAEALFDTARKHARHHRADVQSACVRVWRASAWELHYVVNATHRKGGCQESGELRFENKGCEWNGGCLSYITEREKKKKNLPDVRLQRRRRPVEANWR